MNNKDTLVFVNGELLLSSEYKIPYLQSKIIFYTPLNSSTQSTISNVIIINKGSRFYEAKIEEQNISEIDLF